MASCLESCGMRCGRDGVHARSLLTEAQRQFVDDDDGFRALFESLGTRPGSAPDLRRAAAAASRGRSTFNRDFHLLARRSWHEFVTEWRMETAAAMLRSPFSRVKEVMRAVGYRSRGSFSNAFLKHHGMRPGAFRRSL